MPVVTAQILVIIELNIVLCYIQVIEWAITYFYGEPSKAGGRGRGKTEDPRAPGPSTSTQASVVLSTVPCQGFAKA